MVKQTAGRDNLGTFAPKFAELNDDILFGEIWSREGQLSLKMRSILTVSALVSKGLIDSSLQAHLANAKKNGVTRGEMAEMLVPGMGQGRTGAAPGRRCDHPNRCEALARRGKRQLVLTYSGRVPRRRNLQ